MADKPLPPEIVEFERRYGRLGDRELRVFPIDLKELEVRESGAGEGQFTVRGHAAVFNLWSLDLGGFREKIAKSAFDEVLSRDPDTWLLWDHDTRWTLARTRNKTLELRTDSRGLHYWGRVAPTSYAEDLRVLMERGDIDQASFAFTVAQQEWKVVEDGDGEERIERTILEVGELFDVTITAAGAYPQTDSQVVRKHAVDYAVLNGLLPEQVSAAQIAAQDDPGGKTTSRDLPGGSEERSAAPDEADTRAEANRALKADARERVRLAKQAHLQLTREILK